MTSWRSPPLDDTQKQIIFGTVLGGSSIIKPKKGKNCYLAMRGDKEKWIKCKAQELSIMSTPTSFHVKNNYFRWHSICLPILNGFYTLFYDKDGKRKVETQVLDILRDIGLAVWFIDAGKVQNNCVILNVNNLGRDGAITVNQYFKHLDLNSSIVEIKNSVRVKLDEASTAQFFKFIGHCIPEFLIV